MNQTVLKNQLLQVLKELSEKVNEAHDEDEIEIEVLKGMTQALSLFLPTNNLLN